MLILSLLPAEARDIYPRNDAQSCLDTSNNAGWIMQIYSDTGNNPANGDVWKWYDFKHNNYPSSPKQTVNSKYLSSNNWGNTPNDLSYGDSYGQTLSSTAADNVVSLARYHNYAWSGKSTTILYSYP